MMRKIGLLCLLLSIGASLAGCPNKNTGTGPGSNSGSNPTATNTPVPLTATPTPVYGYVDVSFQGSSLNIWCGIGAFVDGTSIAYTMQTNGVCSKRLPVGPHTVQLQITGGCLDGNSGRLYYTQSGVTSYSSLWAWNLNIQPGMDYQFYLNDYNVSFSSCSYPGMAYTIQTLSGTWTGSCWQ